MNNRQNKERRFWDRSANFYDSFINIVFRKTYKTILENIDLELNINQTVLEIGTGTGIIPFGISSKVSSIVATDISPDMIRVAINKQANLNIRNIHFEVQNCYNLTFPDKSFDIAIAANLLHLLYEPEKAIAEVKRVLKDNGIFIAPTLCVGDNMKSKVIATIAGKISGFRIFNKWSIHGFKIALTNNGLNITKAFKIDDRFPFAFVVITK